MFARFRDNRHHSPAVLHTVPRLHTEGVTGRRHNRRRRVHGRIARGETDVANEK